MSGFATMARQAAEMEANLNRPVTRTATSGVNIATRRRVSSLFKEAKALYGPKGGYMKGIEAQLARGQKKAVATGAQSLAAAGLAGTSMMGGLGLQYEEDVATPARAQAETQRLSALSGLLQAEAGTMANLATRYSTSPGAVSYGGGGRITPTTSVRRPTMAATTQPRQAAPTEKPPLPTLRMPSLSRPAPAGQWQGTIGGTSFYAGGAGGLIQKEAPTTPKKRLSSFYSDFQAASKRPSMKEQLDPYGTFMNF